MPYEVNLKLEHDESPAKVNMATGEVSLLSTKRRFSNLKEDESLINCIANGLTQVIVDNNINIDILNYESKIDKHEDWIGKKVDCWDEDRAIRQNIMTYIGFGGDDSMPYKCNDKDGLIFIWKNIELADDENA